MKLNSFVVLLIFLSCKQHKTQITIAKTIPVENRTRVINYDSSKKLIRLLKIKHSLNWNNLSIPQKEKIFTEAITKIIIPDWIGTAWDFNGTSQQPQKGSIACGYFVTTVLQDGGLRLARVRLAQYASEKMITSLIQPKYIKRYNAVPMNQFMAALKESGYGLYIVGLDNHTGFIFNDGNEIYFIHSTFVGTRCVQHEPAEKSTVLAASKYKIVGKLSADEHILENWIN